MKTQRALISPWPPPYSPRPPHGHHRHHRRRHDRAPHRLRRNPRRRLAHRRDPTLHPSLRPARGRPALRSAQNAPTLNADNRSPPEPATPSGRLTWPPPEPTNQPRYSHGAASRRLTTDIASAPRPSQPANVSTHQRGSTVTMSPMNATSTLRAKAKTRRADRR